MYEIVNFVRSYFFSFNPGVTAQRSYFQDILSVFGSNLSVTVANLVIGIILTRILGASGYGTYSSIIVVPMIVIGFTQLGIRRATMYHLGSQKHPEDSIVSAVFILFLITSVLSVGISFLVFMFSESGNADPVLLTLVLLTVPLVLCNVYTGGIFLGKQEILRANILNAGPTLLNLLFVIIFVWILKMNVRGAFLALLVGNLGMFFFVFYVIRKSYHITWKYHEGIMKSMVRLGFAFALSVFVMQLNYRMDIILLKKYAVLEKITLAQVGLYSLAVQIAEMLWHVPSAIETIVITRSANAADEVFVHKTVASILRVSLLLGLAGCILTVTLAPFFIPLIFGSDYSGSVKLIQSILPGIMFMVLFRILNSRMAGMGKPQIAIYTFLPALVINVVLNILWIPKYQAMGSVWATNLSYATGAIIFLFIYSKKTNMGLREIFHFRKSDFYFIRYFRKFI